MAYSPEPRAAILPEHLTSAIHYLVLSKLNSKICVGIDRSVQAGSHSFERRRGLSLLRKEVIQPQVPLRLPCYDFTPIIDHTLGACLPCGLAQRLLVQSTFVV
jgi:hypothetical protein